MGLATFSTLPPELHIQIFSHLTPLDLKSIRRVCRAFNKNASPQLFRKVVVCPRYLALGAVKKVSLHDVYQSYVKEMVFDGSVYDAGLAGKEQAYTKRADKLQDLSSGPFWERKKRYRRYKALFDEQEEMRQGGVLLQEVARALEWMPNISTLVYSPGPRSLPVEARVMKDLLPRGELHEHRGGQDWNSFIETTQHGFHHLIGAIFLSKYSSIREFRVEAAGNDFYHSGYEPGYNPLTIPPAGTAFTVYVFDFQSAHHVEAGRYFFRHLKKLDMSLSLLPPGSRLGFDRHPRNVDSQLVNLATLLKEARDLETMSFYIRSWTPKPHGMFFDPSFAQQSLFARLGFGTTWPKLHSAKIGGVYTTEEELIGLIDRHRLSLTSLSFECCTLLSGAWCNIVDKVIYETTILPFSLHQVNEALVAGMPFGASLSTDFSKWQYQGQIKLDDQGGRYFDEPNTHSVYMLRSQKADED